MRISFTFDIAVTRQKISTRELWLWHSDETYFHMTSQFFCKIYSIFVDLIYSCKRIKLLLIFVSIYGGKLTLQKLLWSSGNFSISKGHNGIECRCFYLKSFRTLITFLWKPNFGSSNSFLRYLFLAVIMKWRCPDGLERRLMFIRLLAHPSVLVFCSINFLWTGGNNTDLILYQEALWHLNPRPFIL